MAFSCYHYKYKYNKEENTNEPCKDTYEQCRKLLECPKSNLIHDKYNCFAAATNDLIRLENGTTITNLTIISAGCWPSTANETTCRAECETVLTPKPKQFCCCTESGCNDRLRPMKTISAPTPHPAPLQPAQPHQTYTTLIPILMSILLSALLVSYYYYSKKRKPPPSTADSIELGQRLSQDVNPEPQHFIDLNDVILLEVIGSGRFGRVHRAELNKKVVAVKISKLEERESWENELKIYDLISTKHPNILECYGSSISPDKDCYWLCLEYASLGSLHQYLKEHTTTWEEFLSIAVGILSGLSHLHDSKVVHRDLKSKNVLLRGDLSPSITDFGVALVIDDDVIFHRKKVAQVGTPRYMAPEILECSVIFNLKNFLRIDVYSLSLIIWEILSRTYPLPNGSNESPRTYMLPYDEYLGTESADINTMRNLVCNQRIRPSMRPEWQMEPVAEVWRYLEESWEYDAQDRVSSAFLYARFSELSGTAMLTPEK